MTAGRKRPVDPVKTTSIEIADNQNMIFCYINPFHEGFQIRVKYTYKDRKGKVTTPHQHVHVNKCRTFNPKHSDTVQDREYSIATIVLSATSMYLLVKKKALM